MSQTYFKRYRMEVPLRVFAAPAPVPHGYQLLPWDERLVDVHADVKFRSFKDELDSQVFPCLGDPLGCRRLMGEISQKVGFVPQATWLAVFKDGDGALDFCGTVQGIRDESTGGVQNLGVTPEHRGNGLGRCLLEHALVGFRQAAVKSAHLEVTAKNSGAVRLYRQLGFRHVKTVYKSVEVAVT
jgi:ribosomal protein S18 acetylase RimI-like enzyme